MAAVVRRERDERGAKQPVSTIDACADCLHLLRHATCGDPLLAGLVPSLGIVWPPEGHGAACSAFNRKAPTTTTDRPHKLTTDEADRCHAPGWDDAEISAFMARTARLAQMGRADADDLAERLTLREREGDNRRLCLACRELEATGRCAAARRGAIPGADRGLAPVQDILMRCESFNEAVSAHRSSQGKDDANDHH